MATTKSLIATCFLLLALSLHLPTGAQNNCPAHLTQLNRCAPFVIPGMGVNTPNLACCTAIQNLGNDCLCSALDILYRLPDLCNLPPTNCGAR